MNNSVLIHPVEKPFPLLDKATKSVELVVSFKDALSGNVEGLRQCFEQMESSAENILHFAQRIVIKFDADPPEFGVSAPEVRKAFILRAVASVQNAWMLFLKPEPLGWMTIACALHPGVRPMDLEADAEAMQELHNSFQRLINQQYGQAMMLGIQHKIAASDLNVILDKSLASALTFFSFLHPTTIDVAFDRSSKPGSLPNAPFAISTGGSMGSATEGVIESASMKGLPPVRETNPLGDDFIHVVGETLPADWPAAHPLVFAIPLSHILSGNVDPFVGALHTLTSCAATVRSKALSLKIRVINDDSSDFSQETLYFATRKFVALAHGRWPYWNHFLFPEESTWEFVVNHLFFQVDTHEAKNEIIDVSLNSIREPFRQMQRAHARLSGFADLDIISHLSIEKFALAFVRTVLAKSNIQTSVMPHPGWIGQWDIAFSD